MDEDDDQWSSSTVIELGLFAAIAIAQVAYIVRHVYF